MIKINQVESRKVEVTWTTGDDYAYLVTLEGLIFKRNKDKARIKELEDE